MNSALRYPILLPDGAFLVETHRDSFPGVLDVLQEAFPHQSRQFFYAITLQDPDYNPCFSLAVQKDNRYLAHVQIFDRVLEFGDDSLRIGGIGSVATRPECRGLGYASALMEHAALVMQSSGLDAGMLYTSIHPFYERLGWKTLLQWEQALPLDPWRGARRMIGLYRPLSDTDYPLLAAMYRSQQQRCRGTLRRSMEYWRMRPLWMSHPGIAVLSGGKVAAYFYAAKYKKDEAVLTVPELGLAEAGEETLDRLFAVMARKALEQDCNCLRGFFFHDPVVKDYIQSKNLVPAEREFRYVMWRDFDQNHYGTVQNLAHERRFLYWQTDGF